MAAGGSCRYLYVSLYIGGACPTTESAMQADELACPVVRGPHSGVTISGVSAIGWGWQMAAYQLDSLEQRIGVIGDVVASGIWMQIQRKLMDLSRKFYTGAGSSPHPLFGGAFRVCTDAWLCEETRIRRSAVIAIGQTTAGTSGYGSKPVARVGSKIRFQSTFNRFHAISRASESAAMSVLPAEGR